MDSKPGEPTPLAWGLEDARREILELRAEAADMKARLGRAEEFVHEWIMGASVGTPNEGERHADWDYGQELEATPEPE